VSPSAESVGGRQASPDRQLADRSQYHGRLLPTERSLGSGRRMEEHGRTIEETIFYEGTLTIDLYIPFE